ncbi:hypothetical protein [Microbacterium sp. SSM24]|uniref:hypothetical protein n=1 Tax=Microbacterium sp. SSM24 TaxID=2991714 RepID=UPI002227FCAC|nr:hypothetical protein [Microbacterium sp. SSM24]MCW3494691.1 hypothetical protein [Microbacterium sp. SSM24]
MTALIAPRSVRTTRFERMLLTAAAGMDRFVATRLERRGTTPPPASARTTAADARADALALGSIGMLPR